MKVFVILLWCLGGFVLLLFIAPFLVSTGGARNIDDLTRLIVTKGMMAPLEEFKEDIGRYPTTEEGLNALLHGRVYSHLSSKWRGPYALEDYLYDPYGRRLEYRCPGIHNTEGYDLWSLGEDVESDEDDVTNWD